MGPVAVRREPTHAQLAVRASTDVAAVRRAVAAVVDAVSPVAEGRGRAELVATELATNLLRHAEPGGWILVRPLHSGCVELIAVDRGPGIADVPAALDGRVPEPGGLGCGLGAVRRASARFDIWSRPGAGTVVLSVLDPAAGPVSARGHAEPTPRSWAGVSVGISEPCGDGWAVAETDGTLSVAVVDGLGHGAKASMATEAALTQFASDPTDLDAFSRRANERMRETRGAAVTLCQLDHRAAELRYLSIGNVSGRVIGPAETRGLVNYSGTLGLQLEPPRAKVVTAAWPAGAALVLWTDGLSTRVHLTGDDPLLTHDPAVVAAALHRDHARNRDDATVVVVRPQGRPE
jgi:anti-sigma regulatory factor (Ser/Thr protein kinase)